MKASLHKTVFLILFTINVATPAVPGTTTLNLNTTSFEMVQDKRLSYTKPAFKPRPLLDPTKIYVASNPGPEGPVTAEAYERIQCPTTACDCTKDLDRNPPFLQINCRYKNLDTIPSFGISNITYDEITFSMQNHILSLKFGAFRNLKVRKIDLEDNNIGSVEAGAFFGLDTVLETLYLQGDGNVEIPYDKITNLVSLTHLKLVNFRETKIPANNKLGSFEKLEILEMHKMTGLTVVEPGSFQDKLPVLSELVFDTVGFQYIPVAALQQLRNIRKLGIHNSKISAIYADSFSDYNLWRLTEIDLRSNQISLIQDNAFEKVCESLEVLDLTLNALNKTSLLAFETKTWKKLHTLNLSYNKGIGSISSGVFRNMPNLQYLNLMDINLQLLSADIFTGLTNLHTAELSYNQILEIKYGAFNGIPNLKDLRLGHQFHDSPQHAQKMDLYPAIFNGISSSLTDLSLEGTPVTADHFWRMIQVLPSLQTLRVSNTGLNVIPNNAFAHNTKLMLIDLGRNNIQELPNSAFLGLKDSLTEIMLQFNGLRSISKCVFKDFNKLHNLMLVGNNLHCDCKLAWLHEYIIKNLNEDENFPTYNYKCASPKQFQNVLLFKLKDTDLTCQGVPMEICSYITAASTSATTESMITNNPTSAKPTNSSASITLHVGSTTEHSFALYWNIYGNKMPIKGYKLDYSSVIDNVKHTIPIHSEINGYEITGLEPEMFYKICVTVEYLSDKETPTMDCKTRQTHSQVPKYEGYKEESTNNTLVIVLVTTAIVVILIIAGLYMLVKYKIQKLKELRLTMASPGLGRFDPSMDYCCQEESSTCTVPNEYTDIQAAKLAQKYKIYSTKQMQRQYAIDNTYHDRAYSTYHKPKGKKRQKQAEEQVPDSKEDTEGSHTEYTEVNEQLKTEVAQRHSAPSRLDAGDLMKSGKGFHSRPLPATPNDHNKPEKNDLKDSKQTTNHVFMTQASVYEPKVIEPMETVEEEQKEKIYHEINGDDTLPKS